MASVYLAFAGKAVATPVISYLLQKAFGYLHKYWKAEDLKALEKELLRTLPQVQAVFDAVDREQIKEQSTALDAWLWQLRDAIEEAEDSLDELEYYKLKERVKSREKQDETGGISVLKGKFINKLIKHAPKNGQLMRLKEAIQGVHKVISGVTSFIDILKVDMVSPHMDCYRWKMKAKQYETSSKLTPNEVFGLGKEKDLILKWLINNEPVGTNLQIFSIVGHGGFGKTTLAQLIYSEKNVQNYFDLHIWVSVSSHFDALTITKSIIEAITNESTSANTLEALHAILEEKLICKRLLLILDNVWNDNDMNEWEKLFAPLKICRGGSKILLTTRMKSVGDMVGIVLGAKGEHIKLDGLQEKDLLMLFNKYAFSGIDLSYYRNLHSLGEQIVKRLGGCPLAAKVIGAHLCSNMSYAHWKKILQEDFQNLQIAKDGIIKVLRLSYNDLPANLQLCFRYCSIFPQGYKFGKKELMEMWLGSGLILKTTNESRSLEDISGEYLDLLARKSFFDFISIERYGVILEEYYVMHDIMHDMAQSVSSGECLRTAGIRLITIAKTVRHLSIKIGDSIHLKELCCLNKLRSLVIEFVGEDPNMTYYLMFSEVLKNLKALRLLCLTAKCPFHLPDAISNLVHLRYISVFSSKRSFLVSVHKLFSLYHLQALKIMEYSDGKMLKLDGMGNLVCLRNLHVPYDILSSIPRIGNLTCLEELNGFSLQRKKGYSISELKNLTQLRHLRLRDIQNIDDYKEILDSKMKEKKQLRTLSLHWSAYEGVTENIDDLVLESFQPHSDLEGLDIIGYNGTGLPSWMANPYLINLVSLKIIKCGRMEQLPSLKSLCSLKNLYLQELSVLAKIGCLSNGSSGCSSEGTGCTGSNEVFPPHLNNLKIRGCPRLREFPTIPPRLNRLEIQSSGLIHLQLSNHSHITNVLIEDCPNLTSLAEGFLKQHVYLESIRDIHIYQCEKLAYLPSKGLSGLVNLQKLEISYCPMLSGNAFEVKLLPSSLESLTITSCGELENILIGSLTGLNALILLKFSECNHVTALPSTETFKTLTALRTVTLCDCPELSSFGGLQCLESLRYLSINGCHKLAMIPSLQTPLLHSIKEDGNENLLKLELLHIDDHSLLFVEPLRSIVFARELSICDDPIMTSLPEKWLLQHHTALHDLWIWNVKSLLCLPSSLANLCNLQSFCLFGAPLVESVPQMPASLRQLNISLCHSVLEERCRKGGSDWSKIAHIPEVKINAIQEES